MATISYDGHSFLIDGRRTWLVSGAIHYPRTPRQLWRRRIRAARQAGLNCIETYVFWNLHEPRPGVFRFDGDLDLRAFVQMVGEEGMYCIVRPGPFVCAEWDFGGLPPWLLKTEGIRLREKHPAFLEATARYYGAVLEQIKGLQITQPLPGRRVVATETPLDRPAGGFAGNAAGPIIMMQAENEWFCHNPEQAGGYLGELVRYLRENGCEVPINNCNNLWQRIDGTIDTWNGSGRLASDLRQMRIVQPDAPRIVTEYWPGWFDQWDGPHDRRKTAAINSYRLAAMLAVGAQYNLYMFHGGTNFGFYGGRTVAGPACFMTTSYDYDAPLLEAGGRGEKYRAVKRISTFASQFHQLFAHLDPDSAPSVTALLEQDHPPAVVHQEGSQGDVTFLFKAEGDKTRELTVMLPNGLSMPVPIGDDRVAWFVLNANLGGAAKLTYTNLRPWAFLGRRMLVLFGPAGADGVICINDAAFHVKVPSDRQPLVEAHEELTVVVLNHEQVDAAYIGPHALIVGAAELDDDGQPTPLGGWSQMYQIAQDGQVSVGNVKASRKPPAPRLGKWSTAPVTELLDGASEQYKPIDGPMSHEKLGADFGYGWYRLSLGAGKSSKARKARSVANVLAPQSADRLHVFCEGKPVGLLGLGPGAENEPTSLRLGGDVVVLSDNLGRFNYGWKVGESKGLFGHLHQVKPVRLARPKVVAERSPDPFVLRGFVPGHRVGERRPADALVWKIRPAGRKPMILDIQSLPVAAMIYLNGEPVDLYHPNLSAGFLRLTLEVGTHLKAAQNELKLALFSPFDRKLNVLKHLRLYQASANLTDKASWAFAKWSVPPAEAFADMASSGSGPCWHRCTFNVNHAIVPLWLEPVGLTKGQIYLNGHNVGRYFVRTASGRAVPPQNRYYLPEPWLRTDAPNELVVFDEHGRDPSKVKLVYDPMGPYNR